MDMIKVVLEIVWLLVFTGVSTVVVINADGKGKTAVIVLFSTLSLACLVASLILSFKVLMS